MPSGPILITGATGFVGRHVAARLAGQGHPLTLATRRDDAIGLPAGARRVVVGEIGPDTAWAAALPDVSAVIHLAGRVHVAPERARGEAPLFDRVNRAGALRLFEEAAGAGVPLFVFVSSITVLGNESSRGRPFDDRSEPRPAGPYAESKLAAEDALARIAERTATRLVVLRPPLVVGPEVSGNLETLIRLADTAWPLPLGGIGNRRTLLSVDNLSSAIEAVLASGAGGNGGRIARYVLGDDGALSTTQIVQAIREGLGRPPRLVSVPGSVARVGARLLGAGGAYRRLFGDLEVDGSGFIRAFGPFAGVETRTALRDAARAARERR